MRRTLTVGALAVLVIVGGLLGDRIDSDLPVDRSVTLPGVVGQPVAIGQGLVTIHRARAGEELEDPAGEVLGTRGRWIVVEASLQGVSGPIDDVSWWLKDAAGRGFEATDRVPWSVPEAQPGMSVRSAVAFEVAADVELTTATIVMTVGGYRQATEIRVPIEQTTDVLTLPEAELEDLS